MRLSESLYFRIGATCVLLVGLLGVRPAGAQVGSIRDTLDIHLPAQPLRSAVPILARTWNVSIGVDSAVAPDARVADVDGHLTLQQAFGQLLKDTGLWIVQRADGTLLVKTRDGTVSASQLDKVSVVATDRTSNINLPSLNVGVLGARSAVETPYTMQVISRALLEAQQAAYLGDFMKNDPSTVVSNVPVGFIALRGFTVGSDGGFLYDGLIGDPGLSDGRGLIEGIDRVEVLKGPSAFLYGTSTAPSPGGMLNYIPKRPPNGTLRSVEVNYTGRSLLGVATDVGDRFGAERQFGYRLNLAYKNGEQALESYDWRHSVAALGLDWRATSRVHLSGNAEYVDNRLPRLQPFFAVAPGTPVPAAPDGNKNIAQPWDDFRTRSANGFIRADWMLTPQWTVTAKALDNMHYRPPVINARFGSIGDTSGNVTLFGDQYDYRTHTATSQVDVQGFVRIGGITHQIGIGAVGARTLNYNSVSDSSVGLFSSNLYHPVVAPRPSDIPLQVGISDRSVLGSAYVSDVMQLGARWTVVAGLRRGKIGVTNFDIRTGAESPTSSNLWATLPTAAVLFSPVSNASVYANYAEGIERGGIAPAGTVNQNQQLPGLRTKQIEMGAKYEVGSAMVNVAAFDLLRPQEYVDASSLTYVQNGRQRHRGVELTFNGDVTSRLAIVGGMMLLNPRSERTGDSTTQGKRPIGVPTTNGNLWGRYGIGALPGFSVNAGVYYTGAQFIDAKNTQRIDAVTRIDVGAQFDHRVNGREVNYLLSVENVADRDYWTGGLSGLLVLSNPRTVKFTSRVHF